MGFMLLTASFVVNDAFNFKRTCVLKLKMKQLVAFLFLLVIDGSSIRCSIRDVDILKYLAA